MKHDWEYKKLGEVATFQRGLTYSSDDEVDFSTKCVLRSNNINLENSCLDLTELKYLREDFVIPEDRMFCDNSIFICMSNGSKQHIGKVAYIKDKINYAFGGFMGLIVPNPSVQGKFVFYNLRSSQFKHFLNSIGEGANIKNLRFTDLSKYTISTPPLSTQQSIVSELDSLSKIIADCKETMKDYDALEQSIFYDMFGDPVKNDKGWEVKKLGEIGNLARGVSKHRPRNAPELLGGTMPLIQTGDVANADFFIEKYTNTYSELGVAQSKVWKKGTLCITIAATIGKCAILNFDACFPDSVVGFEPNNEISEKIYILFLFKNLQKILEEEAPAVAQKNINLALLNNLTVPLPPLSLQQNFASKIEAIEQMKVETKKALQEAETLFQARMDYWFN